MAQITGIPDNQEVGQQFLPVYTNEIKSVVNQNEAEIYNSLYNIGFTYNQKTIVNQNGFYYATGAFQSSASFRSASVLVNAASARIKILTGQITNAATQLVCYMDSQGDVISRDGIGTGVLIDYAGYELDIPLNCTELRLTNNAEINIEIAEKVADIALETVRKEELTIATLNFEKIAFTPTPDEFYSDTGAVAPSASYKRYELAVDGNADDIYVTLAQGSSTGTQVAVYFNALGELISRDGIGIGSLIERFRYKLNIPSNAVKVGITASYLTIDKHWYIEKGISSARQFTKIQDKSLKSLGDSITIGSQTAGVNYIDTVVDIIRPNWVNNHAVSSCRAMGNSTVKLIDQVVAVGSGNNSIITVMIGTNDWAAQNPLGDVPTVLAKTLASLSDTLNFSESFRLHLETLLVNNPDSKIFVILPINVGSAEQAITLESYRDVMRDISEYLSIQVLEAAKESGLTFARSDLHLDTLHPTVLGQEILGGYISNELTRRFLV